MPWQLYIYENHALCHTTELTDRLQIGRQKSGEPAPIHQDLANQRLVVAPKNDKLVSREHLELSIVEGSSTPGLSGSETRIEVRNLSRKRSVLIDSYGRLGAQDTIELPVPLLVSFESFAVRVESAETKLWDLRSLDNPTLAPGAAVSSDLTRLTQRSLLNASVNASLQTEQLLRWLSEMMGVLQSAAATSDFLVQAIDAVDRIVGLDSIAALRLQKGEWRIAESKEQEFDGLGSDSRAPSRTILERIRETKRTVYQVPSSTAAAVSLQGVKALVASPILNPQGEVIGAIYGARYSRPTAQTPQISELEATMVEVITCSAAAGIAREHQQQQALQARIQFEQFFTPELTRELERNPNLLDGREVDISVLFCDIVAFSSVSQRIGPGLTMKWIGCVMDALSDAVLQHDGVLVDYIGDALLAMWGAPKEQPNHPLLACRAAQAMLQCKPHIDQAWQAETGQPIDFRIGICSGPASVGNTGSTRRLKYGPLGNTVNLASRLQTAAKQFGVRLLVGESTALSVKDDAQIALRHLGTARLVNIDKPISVYELGSATDGDFMRLAKGFPAVIEAIEQSQFETAVSQLKLLATQFPSDQTTQFLLNRVQSQDVQPSCIWHFDTK